MIDKSADTYEASETNARDGILVPEILRREGPQLPPLRRETARWAKHNLWAPHHKDGMDALGLRWAQTQHMALVEGVSSSVLDDGRFWWWTGLTEKGTQNTVLIVYDIDEDGRLHNGCHRARYVKNQRYAPAERPLSLKPFQFSGHGLDRSLERGGGFLPKATTADNLRNKINQLQSSQRSVPWVHFIDRNRRVVRQWLVEDGQGGVVPVREGKDNTIYNATTLSGTMAESQKWLANLSVGSAGWKDSGQPSKEAIF